MFNMENMEEENKDQEFKKGWENYRESVYTNKSKSEDDFEKYINILATGGIVLGFTFMEKIFSLTKISWIWTSVIGLILLVATLLLNLLSHYRSISDADKILSEIDSEDYEKVFTNSNKRNRIIRGLNLGSICFLILGCFFIMMFVTKNLYEVNRKGNNTELTNYNMIEQDKIQPGDTIKLPEPTTGRTNPAPSPTIKPKIE